MHVFVSYSSRDWTLAQSLRDSLESAGLTCWMAPRNIDLGQDWAAEIPPAIDACRVFVLVLSANAIASKQVVREVHLADATSKPIVPLLIERAELSGALRFLLAGVHYLDASDHPAQSVGPLIERVRILLADSQPTAVATLARSSIPNNLPVDDDSLIGRTLELAELAEKLRESRIVTVTGTGGVGKTRIAIKVAYGMLREFPDGVWFVDLSTVREADLVGEAVAAVVGVGKAGGAAFADGVAEVLASKNTLIVLDTCEHLVAGAAAFAAQLVKATYNVRVLCTSRHPLHTSGEVAYLLAPLSAPASIDRAPSIDELNASPAARLLLECAARHAPVELGSEGARRAVAEICRRLDGVPLALELAAARSRSLSFEQIANALGRRFRLLSAGESSADPRKKNLRTLIDWSVELLGDCERLVFYRSGVFAGTFALDALVAIEEEGADELGILDALEVLIDHSLVSRAAVVNGKQRYRLLESLRVYAFEALRDSGRLESAQSALASFIRSLTETTVRVGGAHDILDAEIDNVRTVLEIAVANGKDVTLGASVLVNTCDYWQGSGKWAEADRWYRAVLGASEQIPDASRARLLLAAGAVAFYREDYARVVEVISAALKRIDGDSAESARALNTLAAAKYGLGDVRAAETLWQQSFDLLSAAGETAAAARVTGNLAMIAWQDRSDYGEAKRLYRDAIEVLRAVGADATVAQFLGNLGEIAYAMGSLDDAVAFTEDSAKMYRRLGNRSYIADRNLLLAKYALAAGDRNAAGRLAGDALTEFTILAQPNEIADTIAFSAEFAIVNGDDKGGCTLLGFSARMRGRSKRLPPPIDVEHRKRLREQLTQRLGVERVDDLWARGETMSPDEAVAMATRVLRNGIKPPA